MFWRLQIIPHNWSTVHAKTYRQSKHEKNIPETDLQGICKPVEIIGHLFIPEDEPKILDALKYV